MGENTRDNVEEFFEESKRNPWGRLLAVTATACDLEQYIENDINDTLQRVLKKPDWFEQSSEMWHDRNSSADEFFLFKIYELYHSIKRDGLKAPVHIHSVVDDNTLEFWPSNNKIQVLAECFPDMEFTVLYHDYDAIRKNYPDDTTDWYTALPHREITSADEYCALYGLDKDSDQEIGWGYVKDSIDNQNEVWGKLKPIWRTWKRYKDDKRDQSFENALHITVTDRFHRVEMRKNARGMNTIIHTRPGQASYCGRWYDIDE